MRSAVVNRQLVLLPWTEWVIDKFKSSQVNNICWDDISGFERKVLRKVYSVDVAEWLMPDVGSNPPQLLEISKTQNLSLNKSIDNGTPLKNIIIIWWKICIFLAKPTSLPRPWIQTLVCTHIKLTKLLHFQTNRHVLKTIQHNFKVHMYVHVIVTNIHMYVCMSNASRLPTSRQISIFVM